MRTKLSIAFLTLLAWLFLPVAVPGAEEAPVSLPDVADRLFSEAERQHLVDQRLEVVVERFRAIIADLVSNELLSQAKGAELQQAVQVLQLLASKHVPNAARYLEEARQQLLAMRPQLKAADGEIAIILRELDRLLKRVGPQQSLDDLLNDLRAIIKQEKSAQDATKKWGAQLYQAPSAAERERRPLAENQSQIADRTSRFEERLRASVTNETDTVRKVALEKASQIVQQKPIAPLLSGAAADITQKRPLPAVTKQTEALQALEALEKLLQPDDVLAALDAMQEMRAQLEALLKDQEQLRQRTESIAPTEFEAAKNPLQAGERDLQNRLTQIRTNAPPTVSEPVRTHINDAGQDMKQAETQIAQTQPAPAVTSQKKAEEDLKQAIKALDQDIAALEQPPQNVPDLADLAAQALELADDQKALREQTAQTQPNASPQKAPPQNQLGQRAQALQQQLPLPQFQTAVSEMQSASQQLQQSQPQPATQNQANAEQALREAAQALNAAAQAMQLAEQQAQLMQQTGAAPLTGLPQLTPPQNALGQQATQMQLQQAADFMQQASQSLEQQQGQKAMGEQQSAINSLVGAAEGALGMEPGTMPGTMGLMGLMPGFGLMPGLRAMNVPGFNPREIGSRSFGRQNAAGPNSSSGDARWGAISPREHDALYQKFARELPLEYRDLIEAYYEALAK